MARRTASRSRSCRSLIPMKLNLLCLGLLACGRSSIGDLVLNGVHQFNIVRRRIAFGRSYAVKLVIVFDLLDEWCRKPLLTSDFKVRPGSLTLNSDLKVGLLTLTLNSDLKL